MKKRILIFAVILTAGFFSSNYAQNVIPIVEVRQNDADGVPVHLDEVVTISGIVTSSNQFGNSGPGAVQDETAGVSIYGAWFANAVQIGDSVTVKGKISHYNGLTEIVEDNAGFVTVHSSGASTEPITATLSEIANQTYNDVEEFEGLLVRVDGVTISGSGFFQGNTNYTITDATGSSELRIDNDVDIVGTAIPSGEISVIAVVGQYDFGPPYNDNYQILPRFIEDLITENYPLILSPVIAADITTNSFTVYFNTLRNGDSEVRYGLTDALEIGSVLINEDTTYHVVPVDNLEPLTTYYFKAFSSNDNGTSESSLQTVTTASPNPETGTINVYFNNSVDHSVAIPGNEANGNSDFKQLITQRINSAVYSIDMALYSFFGMNDIANTIIAARDRGVKVRVVYHNRNTQSSMQLLINAGIKVQKRTDSEGLMHNKFAVFDGRDENPDNDWVWTGSWNWTSTELSWRNNVVEINDPTLAGAYTTEFEEMWGSTGDNPNPSAAKFGNDKTDNTPHSFSIGGRPVRQYFSPSDQTESHIYSTLATADTSIYFQLLAFTSNSLYNIIESRFNAGADDLRGIINDATIQGSEYNNLLNLAPGEIFDNSGETIHHKYSIIDASYPFSDPTTVTGSHNWSASAENDNDENTLIIDDIYIANQFMQEFKKRYNEQGGSSVFVTPVITSLEEETAPPDEITLYQNYPNPFNPATTISYSIPSLSEDSRLSGNGNIKVTLKIYNILGKEVATIVNEKQSPGNYEVEFKAGGLPSGVYIYSLNTGVNLLSKKFVLLK